METKIQQLGKRNTYTPIDTSIIEDYLSCKFTSKFISEKYNLKGRTLYDILEKNKIKRRNRSESVSLFKNRNLKRNRIDCNGYSITTIDKKTVKTHRIIMEKILCRKLKPTESIHHIDFDKFNNNSENLCVMTNSEHSIIHSSGVQKIVKKCLEKGYVIFNKEKKEYQWVNSK